MAKKRQAKKAENKLLAKVLIVTGITLFLLGVLTHTQTFYHYWISQREHPVAQVSPHIPVSLSIPAIHLSVHVVQGGIVDGEWVLSDHDALYLPTSGSLGEGYNTILYAHNTWPLFGKLSTIKNGDLIEIKDTQGTIYTYKVFSFDNVNPKDLRSLYSSERNIVTLFTCSGWADTTRLLVKASLVQQ